MRLQMRLLLLLIAIDPDLPGVLLGGKQLLLLIDLVEELLSLDIVLLLQRLLFDLQRISFPLDLGELLLLLVEFLPEDR